jgi:general secretion pathway protein D
MQLRSPIFLLFLFISLPVSAEEQSMPLDLNDPVNAEEQNVSPNSVNAEEKSMTLNLNDADIRAFVATVSEMTGKNFIIDPRVKGRVTVVFSTPTTPENIYEIFLAVLNVHGFSAVPSGDVIKIIPNAGAKQDSIPTVLAEEKSEGEKKLTRVVQVNHADATQLSTILRPLLPQYAHIAAHASSNTLVITDSASNVNRIVDIIHRIDQANNFGVEIIKLKHARAETLVQTLSKLVKNTPTKSKAPTGQGQSISADERTNSLILNGDPSWRANLGKIITKLDMPVANEGNTEVIYLKFANAKKLSEVLRGVGDKMVKSNPDNKKKQSQGSLFDIQAEESTNALVLTAPSTLMKSLKSVISQLDIRREQVHIEAIIVEVSDDKTMDLGVEWETSGTSDGYYGTSLFSTALGIGGSGLSLGFYSSGDLRAVLKTFAKDTDANILSTPSLVTLDNEEASIVVGENVPFVTGQYTNDAAGATNPFKTIERQDVGIKLTVTPHINEGETIELKIEQEVSSVAASEKTTEDGITTKKRNIKTTVLVDNGEIIVLGGLMSNDLTETDQKIPLLGDIPILGHLFSSKSTVYNKKNLMVFLRPRILRDKTSNRDLANEHYSRIRHQQREKWKDGIQLMPNEEPPLLPAREYKDSTTPAPVSEIDLSKQ